MQKYRNILPKPVTSIDSEEQSACNTFYYKTFTCRICYKTYVNEFAFTEHLRNHPEINFYKCPTCEKSVSSLLPHICMNNNKTETNKRKKYVCSICQMDFDDKSALDLHFQMHSTEEQFKKPSLIHTTETISSEAKKIVHGKSVNNVCNKTFSCAICHEILDSELTFIEHLRNHSDLQKSHKCALCGKSFLNKYYFAKHTCIPLHPFREPYKCEFCASIFYNKFQFEEHILFHTDSKINKNYTCSVCQETFTNNETLEVHFQKHSKENYYECPFCAKTFDQNDHLEGHMQSHIQVTPSLSVTDDKTQDESLIKQTIEVCDEKQAEENPNKFDENNF